MRHPTPLLLASLLLAALARPAMIQATAQEYTFTTLAGPLEPGQGAVDGPGAAARFAYPQALAVDSAGNVYVADAQNTIRKVTQDGMVTTLAGLAGTPGSADGTGSGARFGGPAGVAVDGIGNLYVVDGNSIREVTPAGAVTTLAGGGQGSADGTGLGAQFSGPSGLALDNAGNLYVADTCNQTIRKVTPDRVVTTLAGLAGSPGSADGTGSAARFNYPGAVAVDTAGNVYVADTQNYTIRRVTQAGIVTTVAGLAGSSGGADGTGGAARFFFPYGVAVDRNDSVYVADSFNHRIAKLTPGGVVTTLAGMGGAYGSADGTGSAAQFFFPHGVAVDTAGNVYVADMDNCTIRKVTPSGVVTTMAGLARTWGSADGTGSAARFNCPRGPAVSPAGDPYVADQGNHTIRKVGPGGVVTTLAGLAGSPGSADGPGNAARFSSPSAVAVDSLGNAYVADNGNHTIRKITPGGLVTTLAGLAGYGGSVDGLGSGARFCFPEGVAVDGQENVYVADRDNCTVRKVTPAGVVTTLAGLAGVAGTNDGAGTSARFNHPYGVAVDSAANVYVADNGNVTIRRVTPDGVVTTLAGLAGSPGRDDGVGGAARFCGPWDVATDGTGNVYVADACDSAIRKVTPAGLVTTLSSPCVLGGADGTGLAACFYYPEGAAVGTAGTVYVADTGNYTIRIGAPACPDAPTIDLAAGPVGQSRQLDTSPQTAVAWQWRLVRVPTGSSAALWSAKVRNPTFTPDVADLYVFRLHATNAAGAICIRTLAVTALPAPPAIVNPPPTQTAEAGGYAVFSVEATNLAPAVTCQWYSNCTEAIVGATNSYLDLGNVQPAQAGLYSVVVTDPYGSVTSDLAALSVIPPVTRRVVPALSLGGASGGGGQFDYHDAFAPGGLWLAITNHTIAVTPQFTFDLSDPLPPQRFYRAGPIDGPPPVAALSMATEIPLAGAIGTSVRIDYINAIGPTNAWVTLDTVLLNNSPQLYFDTTAFRQPTRLYRLVPGP